MRVVLGILLNENNEIYVTKRQAGKPLAGLWEFPGGKVEKNESDLAALKRELNEELNIKVLQAELIQSVDQHYDYGDVNLQVYRILHHQDDPQGHEGRWVSMLELNELPMPEGNKQIMMVLGAAS